jgi:hypothetical protein
MFLEIQDLWSPDLNPPSSGLPPDVRDFSVFMQVTLSQRMHRGEEVFSFFVCSPGRSASDSQHSFCLPVFEWSAIERVVFGLLNQCDACKTWEEVVEKLAPQLEYADK